MLPSEAFGAWRAAKTPNDCRIESAYGEGGKERREMDEMRDGMVISDRP